MAESLYSIFMIVVMGAVALLFWQEKQAGVPAMPTMPWVRRAIFAEIKRLNIKPRQIAELGSGWGTMVFALHRLFPQARITGYEISLLPYLYSRVKLLCFPKTLRIHRQDFMNADLRGCDLVFCYLKPDHIERLKAKFKDELQPGTWIISNGFAIQGWTPEHEITIKAGIRITAYFYRM